jgi:pSer/pThr/pTyr-binding forkhead associated (FHA) protein
LSSKPWPASSVSRVHALLVHVDDRLFAIDVASTNGTRLSGGADVKVIVVEHDAILELGGETLVRWCWTS